MRVGACPGVRPEGWLGDGECGGHAQHPIRASDSLLQVLQKWRRGVGLLVSLVHIRPAARACSYFQPVASPYRVAWGAACPLQALQRRRRGPCPSYAGGRSFCHETDRETQNEVRRDPTPRLSRGLGGTCEIGNVSEHTFPSLFSNETVFRWLRGQTGALWNTRWKPHLYRIFWDGSCDPKFPPSARCAHAWRQQKESFLYSRT